MDETTSAMDETNGRYIINTLKHMDATTLLIASHKPAVLTGCDRILVLDNVTNSYNVGSFIRLADAFAIEKIIVCGALTISDKKLRKASRNEAKWVCVEYSDSTT